MDGSNRKLRVQEGKSRNPNKGTNILIRQKGSLALQRKRETSSDTGEEENWVVIPPGAWIWSLGETYRVSVLYAIWGFRKIYTKQGERKIEWDACN